MKTPNRPPARAATRPAFRGKSTYAPAGDAPRGKGKPRFGKTYGKRDQSDERAPKRFYPEKPRREKPSGNDPRREKTFQAKPHQEASHSVNPRFDKKERPQRDDAESRNPRPHRARNDKRGFEPRRTSAPVAPVTMPQRERDSVLVWGLHAVRAAWLNPKRRCFRLWVTETSIAGFQPMIDEARDALLLKRPDPKKVDRQELDRLTPPGSVHQGIVLEIAALPEPSLHDLINGEKPPELLIMLDQVTDPHNVGAILRSAAAFGAGAVIMTERNAPTTTGVLAKSASGALEHVPMIHVVNLSRTLDDLKQAGYWSVGLAEEGERDLGALDLSGRTVIVLGNEGEGLRQLTRKKCDELARLPTGGAIGSLNVSNAAAVALYEVRRQKKSFG